ncbi:DUF397 domain-containing protein [Saccharopolyspora sp. NPDC050389]|uniref:DUF397 domain-containing protein n=1 Tax=Saccharopolyspora sp. NPDC050389 TaxID=3155516 RepID=UPI0033E542CE
MDNDDLSRATWQKSSYSNGSGGDCVEVAMTPKVVGVRDTKDRNGGTLTFDPDQWRSFLRSLDSTS